MRALCCCCPPAATEDDKLSEEEEILSSFRAEGRSPRARVSARNDVWWAARIHRIAFSTTEGQEPPSSADAKRRRESSGEVDPRHMTTAQLRRLLREQGQAVDDEASRAALLRQLALSPVPDPEPISPGRGV